MSMAAAAKSSFLLDVKPWGDETDMDKLEEAVRNVNMEGLTWGALISLINIRSLPRNNNSSELGVLNISAPYIHLLIYVLYMPI